MYQGSAVACAMFLTGQASNILGAGLAHEAGERRGDVEQLVHLGDRPRHRLVHRRAVGRVSRRAAGNHRDAAGRRVRARSAREAWGRSIDKEATALAVFAGVGRCG